MSPRKMLLPGVIALILSACGGKAPEPTPAATPVPAPVEQPAAPAQTAPIAEDVPAPAADVAAPAPAAAAAAPAVVSGCATTIESNDAMKYNADSITVPSSCAQFTITLKHAGTLPVGAMGHNLVVAKAADMNGIAADGMAVTPDHLKAGDTRVIAHTRMIGGGESASVTFDVAKLKDGGPFKFFCTFPGHLAVMQGSLQVG